MRPFLAALSVLSALPLGKFAATEADLKRALPFFPVAGLLFGALGWGAAELLTRGFPPAVAAMLCAVLPEALTKGFHLDGLADTADGFLSGRTRERKLEIMRDSRTGSMGVAAVFALLGLKAAACFSFPPELLPAAPDGTIRQKTEDIIGPYEIHDFFLYHFIKYGAPPEKLLFLAERAFGDEYPTEKLRMFLRTFLRRFFSQQFKRSCSTDGPKVGSISLSPRGDWRMPSDASAQAWNI